MAGKILGKLKGLIASASEKSRNGGRKYTENFWDGIFNSDLFIEGMENKMYFGELYHPEDEGEYGQIHPDDRAAVVLTDVEKQGLDYIGTFDILPTKAGETLKNLIDIGCIFGVSSRGYSDYETLEFNDPSTFDLITFDIVAFPGIKSARLHPIDMVYESIGKKRNKVKIMESLNVISENNIELKNYINNTLDKLKEVKEDFDDTIHIEELSDLVDIEDKDLLSYAIIIKTDSKGSAYYNGPEGLAPVSYAFGELEPNSTYLFEDIYFDTNTNTYSTFDSDIIKIS